MYLPTLSHEQDVTQNHFKRFLQIFRFWPVTIPRLKSLVSSTIYPYPREEWIHTFLNGKMMAMLNKNSLV